MSRRTARTRPGPAARSTAARAAALLGALALTAGATLVPAAPALADGNPDVNTGTLVSPTSDGAMLNILMSQGIDYVTVTDPQSAAHAGGRDATLVIDDDESLDDQALATLTGATFGRIVILAQDPLTVSSFLPSDPVSINAVTSDDLTPDCTGSNDIAASAGQIENPGSNLTYAFLSDSLPPGGSACYPIDGAPSMVEYHDNGTDIILLGSTDFLENQYLADAGNADLALRVFGSHRTLVWLAADFHQDPALGCQNSQCGGSGGNGGSGGGSGNQNGNGGGGKNTTIHPGQKTASPPTVESLLPNWIWWVALQVLVAFLLLGYWRARRQGRVVTEPLPVTVRAAETVEGHARLYRRAGARGHCARLLRQATAIRLAPLFGLPQARAEADPSLLAAPIAARLGVPTDQVGGLLAGPEPTTDAELVLLADHLDHMEQEVRSS